MSAHRALSFTRAEIEAMLDNVAADCEPDIELASKLFDEHRVTVLDGSSFNLPEFAIGYHLEEGDATDALLSGEIAGERCALMDGSFARGNACVLKTGHPDLKCSKATCSRTVCPFGLAACFTALDMLGSSNIPLYSESIDLTQAISRFRKTWSKRLVNSDTALNLLLSRSENDFSGLLIVEDDAYLDEFIDDASDILKRMGKIDEGGVRRQHITGLLRSVNSADATFHSTQDENLAPRQLYVCDRIGDFFQSDASSSFAARYLIERFGHIVDHRYLILVGSRADLTKFIGLSPALEMLLGEHTLELSGVDTETIYETYCNKLEESIRAMIDDEFHERFTRYVEFNADALPFHGIELADYLAKTSNASGTLTLPRSRYQSSSLDEMLDNIVGLDSVKHTIKELEAYAIFAKRAKGKGHAMPSSSMHMLFSGNPGTGKTTVARIISTMLYKIGIIPQNKFMEVTSKDLIAKYVGHTDKQVNDVVQKARGGVLFIDEAYALAPNPNSDAGFSKEAIAEIVKCMEDYRDDLVVILAGYEREMQDFIDVNPGLASRISYRFHFDDFTTDQLIEIFMRELDSTGFTAGEGIEAELSELFDYFRNFKSFGNGRFAREVLQKAIISHANRIAESVASAQEGDVVIERCDIPDRRAMLDALNTEDVSAEALLGDLIGLEHPKEKVLELERVVTFRERARRAGLKLPETNLHMTFLGNPGTGKTTIARIIAKVLFNVGAVASPTFKEIEAKDLIRSEVGGTAKNTAKAIESVLGGVLFIDEAYALLESSAGREALATLVKAMEDRKGEFVVMLAGYDREMRELLDANSGLSSRVGYTFRFDDYDTDELLEIFMLKMSKAGFTVDDEAREAARSIMRYFHNVENFGNGRFVDRVIQEVIALKACDPSSELGSETDLANLSTMKAPSALSSQPAPKASGATSDSEPLLPEAVRVNTNRAITPRLKSLESEPHEPELARATPLATICARHIPSIESLCKMTAAAVYQPADVEGAGALARIAHHEAGHALVSLALTGRTDIATVTIEQEGTGALGYVQHERACDPLPTAADIESRIAVLMAGMAAEKLICNDYSTGNSSDLAQATDLALNWAATWGMSPAGFIRYTDDTGKGTLRAKDLPPHVLEAMNGLLDRGMSRALETLERNEETLRTMASALLEDETMTGDGITAIWKNSANGAGGADSSTDTGGADGAGTPTRQSA